MVVLHLVVIGTDLVVVAEQQQLVQMELEMVPQVEKMLEMEELVQLHQLQHHL